MLFEWSSGEFKRGQSTLGLVLSGDQMLGIMRGEEQLEYFVFAVCIGCILVMKFRSGVKYTLNRDYLVLYCGERGDRRKTGGYTRVNFMYELQWSTLYAH